jgi:hypothetical protein
MVVLGMVANLRLSSLRICFVTVLGCCCADVVAVRPGYGQNSEIPLPLLEMVSGLARLKNAEFSYNHYSAINSLIEERPIGSDSSLMEYGNARLDFSKRAFRWEAFRRTRPGEAFSYHVLKSVVGGVAIVLEPTSATSGQFHAVVGANNTFFCPFNMLGQGFAINNEVSENSADITHLADLLMEGRNMGIEQLPEENAFVVKSIGSKERYSGEYRSDLVVYLDSTRDFAPKKLEFRARKHDDPSFDQPMMTYTVVEFASKEWLYFPLVVDRQMGPQDSKTGTNNRWIIDQASLKLNAISDLSALQLDLTGIPGVDLRTNTKFNQPDLGQAEKEVKAITGETVEDRDAARRFNSLNRSIFPYIHLGSGLAVMLLVALYYLRNRGRNAVGVFLLLAGTGTVLPGCNVRDTELAHAEIRSVSSREILTPKVRLPVEVDYGKSSSSGDYKSITVPFVNLTSGAVKIKDIMTTCGCVQAKWDKESVQPGETVVLEAEVSPPKVGSPKSVEVRTRLETDNGQFDLLCPISVKHDIDWMVEEASLVRGNVGEIGFGELVVVVKPGSKCPVLKIEGVDDVTWEGKPEGIPNDPRRFRFRYKAPVREAGRARVGLVAIVAPKDYFPDRYEVELNADGKPPGVWSERFLVVRDEMEVRLFFSVDAGWRVKEIFCEDSELVRVATDRLADDGRERVDVSWVERPTGAVTLVATVERGEEITAVSVKLVFSGAVRSSID